MSTPKHGDVPVVTAAATLDGSDVAVFLVNRSAEPVEIELSHPGVTLTLGRGVQVTADHEPAVAGPEHAALLAERHVTEVDGPASATGATVLTLAPESWTALPGTLTRV